MNSVGSGTVIGSNSRESLILTCQHVVPNGLRCTVQVGNDRYEGTVVKTDVALDLALVTIPVPDLQGVPLERTAQVQPGERLSAHSFPRGLSYVSERRLALGTSPTRLTVRDAWVDGQSGGAVLNAEGRLVGVILGNLRDGSGLATSWPAIVAFTSRLLTVTEPAPTPPPSIPSPLPRDTSADVARALERIESRLTALEQRPAVPGPPGPEGRPGRDGIEGKPGPAGAVGPAGRVDAASLLKQIPPITFELVDPDGRVLDRISAPPGGTVRLRLKPKQE